VPISFFPRTQIELVTTFADQAVIAIENVRLFEEIQDKSRQLAEASQHSKCLAQNNNPLGDEPCNIDVTMVPAA
jgi:two-component system NtrC family sensor kinase